MFINKQKGIANNDLTSIKTLEYYLELTKNFKSSFGDFHIKTVKDYVVIDESESCPVGYKARSGECLIQDAVRRGVKEIVYVQPRRGFAGISLSYLCKLYNLKLTLVMPSSKEVSDHQALCIQYGAKPLFARIAAMPNANRLAKIYADNTPGCEYVPLGLNHELVVAGGVRLVHDFFKDKSHPNCMWTVISTGVLTRSLQIALPNTEFKAIAVSRNIQHGELGKAEFFSYHKPFDSVSDNIPKEFDCENSYDAKGWDYMLKYGLEGDWFFNVAGNAEKPIIDKSSIDSYRDWNDLKDFKIEDYDF